MPGEEKKDFLLDLIKVGRVWYIFDSKPLWYPFPDAPT